MQICYNARCYEEYKCKRTWALLSGNFSLVEGMRQEHKTVAQDIVLDSALGL